MKLSSYIARRATRRLLRNNLGYWGSIIALACIFPHLSLGIFIVITALRIISGKSRW